MSEINMQIAIGGRDECFTHVNRTTGEVLHFATGAINKVIDQYHDKEIEGVSRHMLPVVRRQMEFIKANGGYETERALRLTPEYRDKPIIGVFWDDGHLTIIDGNHRYVRCFHDKIKYIKAHVLHRPFWQQFLIPSEVDPEKMKEWIKTGKSGLL